MAQIQQVRLVVDSYSGGASSYFGWDTSHSD